MSPPQPDIMATPTALSEEPLSEPPPLEPALSDLIVDVYEGARDEAYRYHTEGEAPGFARFKDGNTYRGAFSRGMMHGKGKYTWKDGTTFEGDFKWNLIDGAGVFKWPDGSTYQGELMKGLRHGQGAFVGPRGSPSYSGAWSQGKRHGFGTLCYDLEKRCRYEGEWVANARHGQGTMRYTPRGDATGLVVLDQGAPRALKRQSSVAEPREGNTYTGAWENDKKNGHGVMVWHDRGERYTGQWVEDEQDGEGEHVWLEPQATHPAHSAAAEGSANEHTGSGSHAANGTSKQMSNRYSGMWRRGERHGHGVFTYAHGARYDGGWAGNCKEGYGVLTFEDGHVYAGPFKGDRLLEPDLESPFTDPDATMQPQLRLHVDDLFPSSSSSSPSSPSSSPSAARTIKAKGSDEAAGGAVDKVHERLQLQRAALRYSSELRSVYAFYASKAGAEALPADGGVFALSLGQFRRLWADCGLGSFYDVSLATCHRLAAAMRCQHASEAAALTLARGAAAGAGHWAVVRAGVVTTEEHTSANVYRPDQPLLFREFIELLARIACVAFQDDAARNAATGRHQGLFPQLTGNDAATTTGGGGGGLGSSRGGTARSGASAATAASGRNNGSRLGTAAPSSSSSSSSNHHHPLTGRLSTAGSTGGGSSTGGGRLGSSLGGGGEPLSPGAASAFGGGPGSPVLASASAASAASSSSARYVSPADALKQLMAQAVQGHHSKTLVKDSFEALLEMPEHTQVIRDHEPRLRRAFTAFGTAYGNGGTGGRAGEAAAAAAAGDAALAPPPHQPRERGDGGDGRQGGVRCCAGNAQGGVLTLRGLLLLVRAADGGKEKARGGLGLADSDVLKALVVADEDENPLWEDPTLLESELTYPEFLEALAHVAHIHRPGDIAPMVEDDAGGGSAGGHAGGGEGGGGAESASSASSGGGGAGGGGGGAEGSGGGLARTTVTIKEDADEDEGGLEKEEDDVDEEAADKVVPGSIAHLMRQRPLHENLAALLGKLDLEAAAAAAEKRLDAPVLALVPPRLPFNLP